VIVMEALGRMSSNAVDGHYMSGFTVGGRINDPLTISHLVFANDTLIL
jgi:hypothetical protein